MFAFLGKAVARVWPALLVGWAVLLAVYWFAAPKWDAVTGGSETDFLPAGAPSRRAEQLLREAFPDEYAGSSVVLVLSRTGEQLQDRDRQFIEEKLTPRLKERVADIGGQSPLVTRVRTFADPGAGALLVSRDKQATLVAVEVKPSFLDPRAQPVVEAVEGVVTSLRGDNVVPEGLDIGLTGSATAGRDLRHAEQRSARTIEVWTVVLVIVLLLILYRAPLVALIPLATVFVAVQVALAALASLAAAGALPLDRDVRIFITVLAYGAGVDYCLFLIARYREELEGGADSAEAVSRTIAQVGGAVTASAGTVIGGIAVLALPSFGKIHQAGLAIPFALAVVLLAALLFCVPLLRLTGRWAFWPQRVPDPRPGEGVLRQHFLPNLWEKLGPALLRRPGVIWLGTVAALTPFVIVALLHYHDQNYNPISELPQDAPSAAGTRVLAQHFPPGTQGPVTILLSNDQVDFASAEGIEQVGRLTHRLAERKDELGLADVRSVAEPLGITPAAEEALASISALPSMRQSVVRALGVYVSHAGQRKGHVTQLVLTLNTDPFAREAITSLDRIADAVQAELPSELQGSQVDLFGATATARDLATVKQGDERLVQRLVPIVVLVLLLVMLRRLVVSVYLVLSVLFSYLATLGATYLVFRLLYGDGFSGLDWKVPIFLFTILVAVGEDYNIFLVARVREEQETHGPLRGITEALARTGRVISACGFLMAGTFASLLSGSLLAMKELGFALALGVLLDTLVVRPILVPAFLILLQDGHLGRLGQYLALKRAESPSRRAA